MSPRHTLSPIKSLSSSWIDIADWGNTVLDGVSCLIDDCLYAILNYIYPVDALLSRTALVSTTSQSSRLAKIGWS